MPRLTQPNQLPAHRKSNHHTGDLIRLLKKPAFGGFFYAFRRSFTLRFDLKPNEYMRKQLLNI
jgi:hypothetical protein